MNRVSRTIKFKKTLAPVMLAILVAGLIAPLRTYGLATSEKCYADPADATRKICLEIKSINPAQPEFGQSFQVTAQLTGQKLTPGVGILIVWAVNPEALSDVYNNTSRSGIVADEYVVVDSSGNANKTLARTLTPAGFQATGSNQVAVAFVAEVNQKRGVGGDVSEVTFKAPPPNPNARLTISYTSQSQNVGAQFSFSALYYPANATTPINSGSSYTVSWDFGDGNTDTGWQVNHGYATQNNFTVKATIKDSSGRVLATAQQQVGVVESPGSPKPGNESGGPWGGIISVVNIVLGFLAAIVRWIVYGLGANIFVPLLDATLQIDASNFTSGAIVEGWTYVRDIVNMFFILALIIIGFGTMLKLESYSYKKLLVNLIMMALLVNFSLVIGRIIIQMADAVQFTFLDKVDGVNGVKGLYANLMATHISNILDGFRVWSWSSSEALAGTATIIMQLVLELAVVITFAALAIFMLIRTVALWILLVISPFAYALAILPATASYAHKWWQSFIKYVLFAPIVAFFLRLVLVVYRKGLGITTEGKLFDPNSTIDLIDFMKKYPSMTGDDSFQGFLTLGIVYMMILAFMWAGMYATKAMGIAGAAAVIGGVTKGFKAPGMFVGKRALGFAGRKWNEKTTDWIIGERDKIGKGRSALFALLNPKAAIKGWEARSKDLKESAQKKAEAAGLQVVEQRLTGGKKVIPRVQQHEKAEEDEFVKQFSQLTREQQVDMADHLRDMKGEEGARMKRALVKVAMANGYVDDLTTDTNPEMKKKMALATKDDRYMNENSDLYYTKVDPKTGKESRILKYNTQTRRAFYKAFLGDKDGELGQSAMRMISQDGAKYGKDTKHWEYLEDSWYDTENGKFDFRSEQGGREYAASELAKQESREQARVAHHALMDLSDDGKIDEEKFRVFATAAVENPGFMQERTMRFMLFGGGKMEVDTDGNLVIDPASLERIQNMMKVSPEAVAVMYQRLMKGGMTSDKIKQRVENGFNVKVRGRDGSEEENHIRLINRDVSVGRGPAGGAAPESARPFNPGGAATAQPNPTPANPPAGGGGANPGQTPPPAGNNLNRGRFE